MRLLILTQYYPPETGAPQNRLHELARRLAVKGLVVEVLTAVPNYPKMEIFEGYHPRSYSTEFIDKIKVHRAPIFVRKSKNLFMRLLNYFSFVITSFWIGWRRLPNYDFILIESPPLFLGISGYALSKIKGAKMIFNVSDLWPESAEKLGLVTNKFFLSLATKLEEFLYRNSALITGQTMGIVQNISRRFPNKMIYWLPNGVDTTYFDPDKFDTNWRSANGFKSGDFICLYAGILGHAQGLEVIIKAAATLKDRAVEFVFIGEGPEKEDLIKIKKRLVANNVHFLGTATKQEIPYIVKAADMAVIPLKKLPLFLGAIPSKIFENLAMKTPILLGVDGEARDLFIRKGRAGLFFTPENDIELAQRIRDVIEGKVNLTELGDNGRNYVEKNFNRDRIAEDFYNKLLEINK